MFERFTDRARKVMQFANQEAQRFNHEYIGTEHILLGLIKEGNSVATQILGRMNVDLQTARKETEKLMHSGPSMVTVGKLPQTPRSKKAIEYSMEEARNLHHNYVGTEHILLGLLIEGNGVAYQVLTNLGLKLDEVRKEILETLSSQPAQLSEPHVVDTLSRAIEIYQTQWLTKEELEMVLCGLRFIDDRTVPGDVLDLGCNSGQLSAVLLHAIEKSKTKCRRVHAFDSFDGLPDKTKYDGNSEHYIRGQLKVGLDVIWETLHRFHVPKPPIIHAGWFCDIDQRLLPEKVALANNRPLRYSWKYNIPTVYNRRIEISIHVHDYCNQDVLPGPRIATEEMLANWEYLYVDADKLRTITGFARPGETLDIPNDFTTWDGYVVHKRSSNTMKQMELFKHDIR